jgi:hypothetical protein
MSDPREPSPPDWQSTPPPPPGPAPVLQPRQPWYRRVAVAAPLLSGLAGLVVGLAIGWGSASTANGTSAIAVAGTSTDSSTTSAPSATTSEPSTQSSSESTTTSDSPTTPTAEANHTCDYLLGKGDGTDYSFVADSFITNTGSVPARVRVTATWRQAGTKPITQTKTVSVPVGATDQQVSFSVHATPAQIDRIQSLDTDNQCTVTEKIIG